MNQTTPLLTIEEACIFLRVGRSKLFRLLQSGQLSSHRVGQRRLISQDSLASFLQQETGDGQWESAEAAFRRGYEQGVWACRKTTLHHLPDEAQGLAAYLAEWLEELHVWRYSHETGRERGASSLADLPPRPPHVPKRILPTETGSADHERHH